MLVSFLAAPQAASGGGGPENVFVVANSRSWASLTIAHHFAALRELPPTNVLYIDWPYSTDKVDVEVFRQKLLIPVLGAINQRGIAPQIDYVVYSSDFPWSIDFKPMLKGQQTPPQFNPLGSITALTFFATQVMSNDPRFMAQERQSLYASRRTRRLPTIRRTPSAAGTALTKPASSSKGAASRTS